jgi:antitoxin YefM
MKTISYADARGNLAATMDTVRAERAPVVIKRAGCQPVVMLSLEEFESMEETAYLMGNPANAKRLLEAISSLESGKGVERKIDLIHYEG